MEVERGSRPSDQNLSERSFPSMYWNNLRGKKLQISNRNTFSGTCIQISARDNKISREWERLEFENNLIAVVSASCTFYFTIALILRIIAKARFTDSWMGERRRTNAISKISFTVYNILRKTFRNDNLRIVSSPMVRKTLNL